MKNSGSANTMHSGESSVATVFNVDNMRCFLNSQTRPQLMAAKVALAISDNSRTLRGASPSTLLIKNSERWLSFSASVWVASAMEKPTTARVVTESADRGRLSGGGC